jgi:hypothetical protein
VSADARVEQARGYLDGAAPVDHLPPSALVRELDAARHHLAALLAAIGELELDGPYPERVMDTDDIDPETGEEWGAEV